MPNKQIRIPVSKSIDNYKFKEILLIGIVAFLVSCSTQQKIWDYSPKELKEILKQNRIETINFSQLLRNDRKLRQIQRLDADAPYFAALLAEDKGLNDVARSLFFIAAETGSKVAMRESLLALSNQRKKDLQKLLALIQNYNRNYDGDTEIQLLEVDLLTHKSTRKAGELFLSLDDDGDFSDDFSFHDFRIHFYADTVEAVEKSRIFFFNSPPNPLHLRGMILLEGDSSWEFEGGEQALFNAKTHLARKDKEKAATLFLTVPPKSPFWKSYPRLVEDVAECLPEEPQAAEFLTLLLTHGGETADRALYHLTFSVPDSSLTVDGSLKKAITPEVRERMVLTYLRRLNRANSPNVGSETIRLLTLYPPQNPQTFFPVINDMSRRLFSRNDTKSLVALFAIFNIYDDGDGLYELRYHLYLSDKTGNSEYSKESTDLHSNTHRSFLMRAQAKAPLLPPLQQANDDLPAPYLTFFDNLVEYGLTEDSRRLLRKYFAEVSPQTIRHLARIYAEQENHMGSVRALLPLFARSDYTMTREDYEIFYPRPYEELISHYADLYAIPRPLLFALVRSESLFMREIVSYAGAVGLSQLMPGTMREVATRLGIEDPDARNPDQNLHIGSYYYSTLIKSSIIQNPSEALMAYNAGSGRVRSFHRQFPNFTEAAFTEAVPITQTRHYVQRILDSAVWYAHLYGEAEPVEIIKYLYPES